MSETKHSPEPWTEDDCNIFSGPLSAQRHEAIVRRLEGSTEEHPDRLLGGEPLGFVAACGQNRPACDADARRIVACVNACAGIPTAALEAGALRDALEAAALACAYGPVAPIGGTSTPGAQALADLRRCLRALGRLP